MTGPMMRPALLGAQQARPTFDEAFARIARDQIPGFAGYYLDKDSNAVVMLVDAARGPAAAAFVALERQRMGLKPARSTIIRHATYDYASLKDWHDRLLPMLGSASGVYMLDIDEVKNHLWLGVADTRAGGTILTRGVALGIPSAAIETEIVSPPEVRDTRLLDYWRPVAGGLQIHNTLQVPPDGPICTLGFTAYQNGVAFFLVNSHCTQSRFGNDASLDYQEYDSVLGQEYLDPPLSFGVTRHSDAAMFLYNAGAVFQQGRIMQTLYPASGGPGSLYINTAQPYFDIRWQWDASTDAPVGTELHKMGRTSGWTGGTVTRTCVGIVNQNYVLQCQWVTTIYSEGGDSGSPIFQPSTNPWPSAALHGILWGGPSGDYNTTYHSPLSGIEWDLGTIAVCIAGTSCSGTGGGGGGGGGNPGFTVSISGPNPIQPGASCQYSAQTVSGTAPFTFAWTQDGNSVGDGTMYYHNSGSDSAFQLGVLVTDANGLTANNTLSVGVDYGAQSCNDQ